MKNYEMLFKNKERISMKEPQPVDQQSHLLTHHEFADLTKMMHQEFNAIPTKIDEKLSLPSRFSLQSYIEPKLDARYITYFSDETNDRMMSLRPNVVFEITATKFHQIYRIDDYYTKIKVSKLYSRYNKEMIDLSITDALREHLYKSALQIVQFVAEHHGRILSCEMEWVRQEGTELVFLSDMRNIIMARQNNKPFTNSLYRHMKRNMNAILDEEKKEQMALVSPSRLTMQSRMTSSGLPPRHKNYQTIQIGEVSQSTPNMNFGAQLQTRRQGSRMKSMASNDFNKGSKDEFAQSQTIQFMERDENASAALVGFNDPTITLLKEKQGSRVFQGKIRPQTAKVQKHTYTSLVNGRRDVSIKVLDDDVQYFEGPQTGTATQVKPFQSQTIDFRPITTLSRKHNHRNHQKNRLIARNHKTMISDDDTKHTSRNQTSKNRQSMRLELLSEHSNKNEGNFFNLIDEVHEEWKDRYDLLQFKGKKQKRILQDKIDKEIEVMNFQIEHQDQEKQRIDKQLVRENLTIEEISNQLKYAISKLQSVQDNIHLENKVFIEKLDKLKKAKENQSTKQVHIQNSLSGKVIEQLEVRLKNQKLEHQLSDILGREEKLLQQDQIETAFREDVLGLFAEMVKNYKAQQEDIFIIQKKPLITPKIKKDLKTLLNKGIIVENQVLLLKQETNKNAFDFYDVQ